MTTINVKIMSGVINSIRKLYLRHDLEGDFVIEIDNTEIKCHRLILESCSEFFNGLFRSGMKEVTNGRATLQDISCDTFKLILEALYTGSDVINKDNVIAIWHASNQLQIDFMIQICEEMVVNMLSLDNVEEVYINANLIDSKQVLEAIKTFILEHFVQVRKMNTFLELSYKELLALIGDHKLVVESEDQVLESIMEWIEYPDIEKLEDEHQNDKRKCTEDIRERSQVIAQSAGETDSFANSKSTTMSDFASDQCTNYMDAKSLGNDNKFDDKCVCPEQPLQGKDRSTDYSTNEVSPGQSHCKTDSTVAQALDQTEKNEPLQQNKNTNRKVDGEQHSYLVPLLNAQSAGETVSFANSKSTTMSDFASDQCTNDMDAKSLGNDNKVDDKCVCPEQPLQGKDRSTDYSTNEVSPGQSHCKTDGTVAQVFDQTEKSDQLQQNNNTKRKVDGERHSYLVPLLNAARTCLASASFLRRLAKHRLIESYREARKIIFDAIIYHTEIYRNGTWSNAGLHRDCSKLGNFGVFCYGEGNFERHSLTEHTFLTITRCPDCIHSVHLVVFDNELYACGRKSGNDAKSKLFLFSGNVWTKVTDIRGNRLFLLSYENSILILNIERKRILSLKPKEMKNFQEILATLPENGTFEHALIYDSKLIVFYAETVEGIEETSVHCFDLMTKIWTRLDNLDGPAKHLISFQDGENNYIIQRNGNVWRLFNTKDKLLSFKFIGKLWTDDVVLYGAVHYKDQLFLLGNQHDNPEDEDFPYSLNYLSEDENCSNFLPVILAKSCLSPVDV